jgi:pimeloyl-ACP methyl ester carboxylesterase
MSGAPSPWDPFDDLATPPVDPRLPEVVLIAGFLGLNLKRPDGVRIWLTPSSFVLRDVARDLRLDGDGPPLVPDGLNRVIYGDLVRDLRQAGFRVHALSFDFRRPVLAVAADLADALRALGPDRRFVFVSHSLGALIAAVYPYVDEAWSSRVVASISLGGPLAGTFEAVDAAHGTHPIIERLSKLSIRDNQADYAACMRTWAGLFDMLPDPAFFAGAEAAFDPTRWSSDVAPSPALLTLARQTRSLVEASPIFSIPCAQLVSLGYRTAAAYAEGPVAAAPRTAPGDGTVPAFTATFGGRVPAYVVDFPHTLLPLDPKAIRGVIDLASTGKTALPRLDPTQPLAPLGTEGASIEDASLEEIVAEYLRAVAARTDDAGLTLLHVAWLLGVPGR